MFEDLERVVIFYMVERGDSGQFLGIDDKGAYSSGYPMWCLFHNARRFDTFEAAEKSVTSIAKVNYSGFPTVTDAVIRKIVCKILDGTGEKVYF